MIILCADLGGAGIFQKIKNLLQNNKTKIFRMICYNSILVIFLLTLCESSISAGYIRMSTTIQSDVIDQSPANLSVSIINDGDETAHRVEIISLSLEDFYINNPILIGDLDSGDAFQVDFPIYINKSLLPGIYPIVMKLKFYDSNNYPYSILFSHLLTYKEGYESNIKGDIYPVDITANGSGTYTLYIQNLDDMPHNIKIKLYLPDEFNSTFSEQSIPLDSISVQKIDFQIKNQGGLPGSSYKIYASLEYDEIHHYSSFVEKTISVFEETEKTSTLLYLVSLIVTFVVLLVIYILLKTRGR